MQVTELDHAFKQYMHYSREHRKMWAKEMIDRCSLKADDDLDLYRQWKREMMETRVIAPIPLTREPLLKRQLTSKPK